MSHQPSGLSGCASNWTSSFCITKTLQTSCSLFLIIWTIIEMVTYHHHNNMRLLRSSFILIVEILMLLTLTFNIAFAVYHTTYALLYLEIYFYNMYFVILCYYLIFNVFKRVKYMPAIIACFIGLLSLIYLLILIDSFIQNVQMCKCNHLHYYPKELSYLIMNSVGLLVSIIMFSAYRYNQINQKKRIQQLNKMLASDDLVQKEQSHKNQEKLLKMRTPSKVDYNQPFKLMWMMIICNFLCQLIDLGESLAFKLQWNKSDNNTCPITQNQTANAIVSFIFVIFTMYLGFMATIYAFREKRKAKDDFQARIKSPSDFSSVASGKHYGLQMIGKQNFSSYPDKTNSLGDHFSDFYGKAHKEQQNDLQRYKETF